MSRHRSLASEDDIEKQHGEAAHEDIAHIDFDGIRLSAGVEGAFLAPRCRAPLLRVSLNTDLVPAGAWGHIHARAKQVAALYVRRAASKGTRHTAGDGAPGRDDTRRLGMGQSGIRPGARLEFGEGELLIDQALSQRLVLTSMLRNLDSERLSAVFQCGRPSGGLCSRRRRRIGRRTIGR